VLPPSFKQGLRDAGYFGPGFWPFPCLKYQAAEFFAVPRRDEKGAIAGIGRIPCFQRQAAAVISFSGGVLGVLFVNFFP